MAATSQNGKALLIVAVSAQEEETEITSTQKLNEATTTQQTIEAPKLTEETAKINDLLYVVLVITMLEPHLTLKAYYQLSCTGTLIAKDLVLTAASCLYWDRLNYWDTPDPTAISVHHYTGTHKSAKKVIVHPEYLLSKQFDMALISLMNEFEQSTFPNLPTSPIPFDETQDYCLIAGYGYTGRLALEHLQVMEYMPNKSQVWTVKCRHPQELCLHFEDLMPCPGDVGSPFICNGELRAIYTPINSITFCQDVYAVTLTKIYPAKDWVSGIINAPSDSLVWMNNPLYILLMCSLIMAVTTSIYCLLMICLQRTLTEEVLPMELQESQLQFPRASHQLRRMSSPETQATDVNELRQQWNTMT